MSEQLTFSTIFKTNKLIPVVVLDEVNKAVALAHALLDGGVNVMEVTLRTPNALQIIKTIAQEVPQMIVGAGTILNVHQYHMAVTHNAQFIVSPGLTSELIDISYSYNTPFMPGAITPTEIMRAHNASFEYIKFFPAQGFNALSVLKSLASPLSNVKFCPTGGIDLSNLQDETSLHYPQLILYASFYF